MVCKFSLDQVLFALENKDDLEGTTEATISLRTAASGKEPLYLVDTTVDLDNRIVHSFVRYDAGKRNNYI